MIAIHIDTDIEKYNRQIKFSIEYILNICGFDWKYLDADPDLNSNDIIIFYSQFEPTQYYKDTMLKRHTFIYIPFFKEFYVPGTFSGDKLKNSIKTIKEINDLPFLCTKKTSDEPIKITDENGNVYCSFEFDLIGNVFFHLSDDNRNHIKKTEKIGELALKELGFYKYFDTPFVNHYIEIFNSVLFDLYEEKGKPTEYSLSNEEQPPMTEKPPLKKKQKNLWGIRRCLWPADQPFAGVITHNLDKMQKWG